ncbi:asparagine synthase (glutamine-hydrolyzing) [Streptomyces huiliensis]|uniref:asparagine synthase (glutamine-hydrolyzing) n=1 Tax=Streptomyces huiliensis TaxID=2876027 RepID=UPI001CBEF4E0|nr:asparagine synthase (glutamine-hydrolyzing) [Streptomyces huiliensis]MBZ4322017.1 asparagine synthase (glutamine-hydrolyzing) [Streptomyces huiliensis]
MCGIAGWVDLDLDLSHKLSDADAMVRTMACRGPDAAGVRADTHAILGHRRLSIIDLEGGAQPMAEPPEATAGPSVVLSYSGEVYNFRELREQLRSHGHVFRTRSDTEVVLRAYLQWGPDFVDRLNGMFGFALWDARAERLLLVRDRLGVKPVYFARLGGGVLFGSEPKAILAHPDFSAAVDARGLADLLGLMKTPGSTPYRGIEEVPPGCVVTLDRKGLRVTRYWRLRRVPHTDDAETSARTVRDILEDTVTRQMVTDVPLCALLSGGLDSSLLTALAAGVESRRGGARVRSFAVDFTGHDSDFRTSEFRPERDSPYALEAARHIGTDHRVIELAADELTADDARDAVLRAHDLPLSFGDVDTSLHLLFRGIRRHSTVALSGESADEVFGGYLWFHDPAAIRSATFPWLSRMQLIPPELLAPDFRAATRFEEYRADGYRQALGEVEHLPEDDDRERRMREISHLNLTRWLPTLLDRKDRLSMATGLEVRVPFCDHRLVEYVYNTPWDVKTPGGDPKGLLKRAASGLVPDSVLRRRKSPYPTTANLLYEKDLRGRIQALLARPTAPVFQVVDAAGLARLLERPEGYFDTQLRRNGMETALNLDAWMRRYEVALA